MVKAMRNIKTVVLIRAATRKVNLMDREFTLGLTEKFMTVNGIQDSSTVMEFGPVLKMILTWVNGTNQKLMVPEYTFGPTATDMKDFGIQVRSMVKELTLSPLLEKHIPVSTKMANHMEQASTIGQLESSMKVTSSTASNVAKVYGENRRMCQTVTSTKASIKMMLSMDMVFIFGLVEISIRDNTSKTSVMAKEK